MKLLTITLTLALTLTVHPSMSATVQCPDNIKTTQALQETVKGWDDFLDDLNSIHHVNRITFYAGHPKDHASLAPDNEATKNNKLIWTFGNDDIWLACGYSNTDIQLIRKLDHTIKTCQVTYHSDINKTIDIVCGYAIN